MSEIPENSAENISDISEEVVPKSKKLSYQERLKQTRKTLAESEKEIFKKSLALKCFSSLAPIRIWLSSVISYLALYRHFIFGSLASIFLKLLKAALEQFSSSDEAEEELGDSDSG